MISNIVSILQTNLNALGVFDIIGGISNPMPFGMGETRKILPFDCDSTLDDCKKGTELQPSDRYKMFGFFEQLESISEVDEFKKQSRYKSKLRFNFWYNCNSITVQNKGNEIDCCDKKGFITESILTTIKKSNLSSDLFSYTSLENFSINDYDFKGYTINERYKYHPYYSFSIDFDVYFILNKNCDNSIDITLIKEVC